MIIKGKAWKFEDNIDTDLIIPAKYLTTSDPAELGKHAMEGAVEEFYKKIKPGDIMVAGENFGCGSSREHAPLSLKGAGISLIIAKSFARIFYRNSINIGLPILECPEAADKIKEGNELEVDLEKGGIRNLSTGKTFQAVPFPDFMREIIKAGGLINYVKQKL